MQYKGGEHETTRDNLIAAVSENNVIGVEGKLPWRLPEDMKRFVTLTTPHPVIMGRVTYESLPKKSRPLPNRQNVVLTSNTSFCEDGVYVARSLEKALHELGDRRLHLEGIDYSKIFIGGGQQVYEAAMGYATSLEITHVHKIVPVGKEMRYFPNIDLTQWAEKKREDRPVQGDKPAYSFVTYEKK